jgi:hypothetical protein
MSENEAMYPRFNEPCQKAGNDQLFGTEEISDIARTGD